MKRHFTRLVLVAMVIWLCLPSVFAQQPTSTRTTSEDVVRATQHSCTWTRISNSMWETPWSQACHDQIIAYYSKQRDPNWGALPASAATKPRSETNLAQAPWPDVLIKHLKSGERFRNPDYFKVMAADGVRAADPKAVFDRMSAAVQAGENYKALYFARLFTDLRSDLPAGWSNRAKLAAALGIRDEAAAAEARAEDPLLAAKVPAGVLPGIGLSVRPKDLSDWAAGMALLSDGIATKEGSAALISVRNDVSGVKVVTPQELLAQDPDMEEEVRAYVIKAGPYTEARPIRLEEVLPNLFSLQDAQPMVKKYGQKMGAGDTFAMVMLGAASGIAGSRGDVTTATTASEGMGQISGKNSAVASVYSQGSFKGVTYTNRTAETTGYQPKPSGQDEAIGWPVPLLWASGGSTTASFKGQIASHDTTFGRDKVSLRLLPAEINEKKAKSKFVKLQNPVLYFPKLATLCAETCTIPMTLMEIMLNWQDVAALAPGNRIQPMSNDWLEAAYANGSLVLQPSAGVAFDEKGVAYYSGQSPSEWLVPAVSVH